jgi:hypothetical protein
VPPKLSDLRWSAIKAIDVWDPQWKEHQKSTGWSLGIAVLGIFRQSSDYITRIHPTEWMPDESLSLGPKGPHETTSKSGTTPIRGLRDWCALAQITWVNWIRLPDDVGGAAYVPMGRDTILKGEGFNFMKERIPNPFVREEWIADKPEDEGVTPGYYREGEDELSYEDLDLMTS